jgi:hypothetical protein
VCRASVSNLGFDGDCDQSKLRCIIALEEDEMTVKDEKSINTPELNDQEWVQRFANGYIQSFDRDSLEDANIVLERIFKKYNTAEAV